MRLRCYGCSKSVSTEVPDETILRAAAYCPECIQAGKIVLPDEARERERKAAEWAAGWWRGVGKSHGGNIETSWRDTVEFRYPSSTRKEKTDG